MKLCISVLIIHSLQLILIDRLDPIYHWITWDLTYLISAVLYCVILLTYIPYSYIREKIIILALLIYNIWLLVEYVLLTLLTTLNLNIEAMRNITAMVSIMIFLPIFTKIIYKKYTQASDVYCDKIGSSFLVYRTPKSFQGVMAALIYDVPGSVFLVVNGKEFKFKRGVVMEGKHKHSCNNIYKSINSIKIELARKLIGTKWSFKNNCFNIFNRFKKGVK